MVFLQLVDFDLNIIRVIFLRILVHLQRVTKLIKLKKPTKLHQTNHQQKKQAS
jgi:hypothetical protein